MEQEAENRFAWTWSEFIKALELDPRLPLRKFCERVHTDSRSMQKWASRHGYSVLELKNSLQTKEPNLVLSSFKGEKKDSSLMCSGGSIFTPVVPINTPKESLSLHGVSVTFNSGTTITIKQGTPSGVIKLIQAYERKDGDSCML